MSVLSYGNTSTILKTSVLGVVKKVNSLTIRELMFMKSEFNSNSVWSVLLVRAVSAFSRIIKS